MDSHVTSLHVHLAQDGGQEGGLSGSHHSNNGNQATLLDLQWHPVEREQINLRYHWVLPLRNDAGQNGTVPATFGLNGMVSHMEIGKYMNRWIKA